MSEPADIRGLKATINHGAARTSNTQRSLIMGNSMNPDMIGPMMQPTTLIAYAFPARSGSPPDQRSTSIGVTIAQNT